MNPRENRKNVMYIVLGVVVAAALIFDLYILITRPGLFFPNYHSQEMSPPATVGHLTVAQRAVIDQTVVRMQSQKPQQLTSSQEAAIQSVLQRMKNQ